MERLEKNVVHDICTNQVVVTLHACVKELVENSLDAGATRIEVKLRESGSELLEVSDNGCGVDKANQALLATRHATSKIRQYDDLSSSLDTFGFRGEALAGICAMGDLTIFTRTADVAVAAQLVYDTFGTLTSTTPAAREMGTTVSVRDLFKRLPVRHREFIRNAKSQVTSTLRLVQSYAIANPQVRFHVMSEKARGHGSGRATLLSTSGTPAGWARATAAVMGDSAVADVVPFEVESAGAGWKISGVLSTPNGGRRSRDMQLFFVNKRPIDPPKRVAKLINDTYHQYNSRMWPTVILAFTAAQSLVDVNVTPDKRTVFLHSEEALLVDIQDALTKIWSPMDQSVSMTLDSFGIKGKTPAAAASSASSKALCALDAFAAGAPLASSAPPLEDACPDEPSSSVIDPVVSESQIVLESAGEEGPLKRQRVDDGVVVPQRFDTPEKPAGASSLGAGGAGHAQAAAAQPSSPHAVVDWVQVLTGKPAQSTPAQTLPAACQSTSAPAPHRGPAPVLDTIRPAQGAGSTSSGNGLMDLDAFAAGAPPVQHANPQDFAAFAAGGPLVENAQHLAPQVSGGVSDLVLLDAQPAAFDQMPGESGSQLVLAPPLEPSGQLVPLSGADESQVVLAEMAMQEAPPPDAPVKLGVSFAASARMSDLEAAVEARRAAASAAAQGQQAATLGAAVQLHFPTSFSLSSLETQGGGGASIDEVAKFNTGSDAAETPEFRFDKGCFTKMRVIGQFNLGFIIASLPTKSASAGPDGDPVDGLQLFIIDQHASDEKFRFETLNRDSKIDKQPLVSHHQLQLTPAQEAIAESNLEVFRLNGFDLISDPNRPPGKRLRVASLPTCQGMLFGEKDIHDLLYTLEEGGGSDQIATSVAQPTRSAAGLLDINSHRALWSAASIPRPQKVWQLLACRACRGAIMIGKALRLAEMEKVLRNLSGLQQPWNCPHGRPTMRHLVDAGVSKRATKSYPAAPMWFASHGGC